MIQNKPNHIMSILDISDWHRLVTEVKNKIVKEIYELVWYVSQRLKWLVYQIDVKVKSNEQYNMILLQDIML